MSLQIPEYIRSLQPYVPGKPIEETRRETGIQRIIKLASNENSLGPSPRAKAALKSELKELHRYPDASGFKLKNAIAEHLQIQPKEISLGNGSNELIDLAIRMVCRPGDAMVTSQAAFVAYRICAQIHGVRVIQTELNSEFCFDLVAMLEKIKTDSAVKIVFIANPNNPTGTYNTRTELQSFLSAVSQIRGGSVLVVLDCAYWEYVTASDLPDGLEFTRQFTNVLALRTFSKIYGLAGLRVGYGVGHEELISNLERIRQPFNLNSLGMAAAEAALQDREFVKRSLELNRMGCEFWEKALRRAGIPFWPSQGNFVLANVGQGLGASGGQVFEKCLARGVIFRPVTNYGLADYLRISFGTASENRSALRALQS